MSIVIFNRLAFAIQKSSYTVTAFRLHTDYITWFSVCQQLFSVFIKWILFIVFVCLCRMIEWGWNVVQMYGNRSLLFVRHGVRCAVVVRGASVVCPGSSGVVVYAVPLCPLFTQRDIGAVVMGFTGGQAFRYLYSRFISHIHFQKSSSTLLLLPCSPSKFWTAQVSR